MTNPGLRLFGILTQIQKRIQEKKKIREVLGDVFAVEAADDLKIIENLILLDGLFVQSSAIISSIDGIDHSKYLRHFPGLRKSLLTTNLDADSKRYTAFGNALNPVALQSVEFCAARMAEEVKEKIIPSEDLVALESQISEVFDFITGSDLEPKLREIALDLLETLRRAIAEYRIRGLQGLEESIEYSLGKLGLYHMRARKEGRKVPVEQIEKVIDIIIKLESLVSNVQAYMPALSEFLPKMLGA